MALIEILVSVGIIVGIVALFALDFFLQPMQSENLKIGLSHA